MHSTALALFFSLIASHDEQAEFLPSEGESLTMTFREQTVLESVHLRIDNNGVVTDRDDYELRIEHVADRRWTDTHGSVKGARTYEFVRSIEQASHSLSLDTIERGRPIHAICKGTSDLQGTEIAFAWNEERGEYESIFVQVEGQEQPEPALLAFVEAETTFAALLSPADHEVPEIGDGWGVPASALREILQPGGTLTCFYPQLDNSEDPDLMVFTGMLSASRAADEVSGDVQATWKGIEVVDGVRLARIELEIDVELNSEPTSWMHEQSRPFPMAAIGRGASGAVLGASLIGTCDIFWNLEQDHLERALLEAVSEFDLKLDFTFSIGEFGVSGDYSLKTVGSTRIELTVE